MSRPHARRPVRATVVALGAAVALAACIGVGTGGTAIAVPAHRASSRPMASAVLAALARTAAAQPAKPRTGRYEYILTKGWYWDVVTSPVNGLASGRLDRDRHQQWIAGDGSGRLIDSRGGHTYSDRFKAGQLSAPQAYPTNPEALQKVLAKSHPAYGTYEWMVAVNDVWIGQVVSPKLESALLRMLVGKPHLRYRGMVTDLQGRRGLAISSDTFHDGRMRTTLIFDPSTGGLLDFEQQPLSPAFCVEKSLKGFGETAWLAEGYTISDRRTP